MEDWLIYSEGVLTSVNSFESKKGKKEKRKKREKEKKSFPSILQILLLNFWNISLWHCISNPGNILFSYIWNGSGTTLNIMMKAQLEDTKWVKEHNELLSLINEKRLNVICHG